MLKVFMDRAEFFFSILL